jgi:hypothetical protein
MVGFRLVATPKGFHSLQSLYSAIVFIMVLDRNRFSAMSPFKRYRRYANKLKLLIFMVVAISAVAGPH